MHNLMAVSPVDGRYHSKTEKLADYFSEYALIRYRIFVEIEYFIELSAAINEIGELNESQKSALRKIYTQFNLDDALRVKEIEKVTNHDVKAVEYFIKERIKNKELKKKSEFIHFGLTSQDINNTAIPLSLAGFFKNVYLAKYNELVQLLKNHAKQYAKVAMLAKTHGQPASPTRLGKEWQVFIERLDKQFAYFNSIPFSAKFGGATGNYNAHHVAYPKINWHKFGKHFVENTLRLSHSFPTTQIEHYDNLAALFHNYARINTILIDFCRDVWAYISMDYFKQQIKAGEVGSSAMPHKVNPINFENAEGNLGIANAIFYHLAEKLPISRLQRDLTDSTVLRNIGVPLAHTMIAMDAIIKGLNGLLLNEQAIQTDLEKNWIVVAEAIQTVLRREGYPQPYEALKALTRTNKQVGKTEIHAFISELNIEDALKTELKKITPFNYTGI
ncbi:MAG TPA: adenylosuccinate lyase [Chitinophagales bacterium]|nr:adenylosuccinate lyase [Chitinophagales bacterium]